MGLVMVGVFDVTDDDWPPPELKLSDALGTEMTKSPLNRDSISVSRV